MAMSQFSYGALASYQMRGEMLPVDGGFDLEGKLTRDPGAIEASNRPLPIGFWKGSGLALMLDLLATLLSGGRASYQIEPIPERETRVSQVFIAMDPSCLDSPSESKADSESDSTTAAAQVADQIIAHFQTSPLSGGECVRYPGYRVLQIRKENLANGIPVDPSVWHQLQSL
jgi:3-dehydro-L-gulonate 2-dehydrogenase